jgi:hypothetical protein
MIIGGETLWVFMLGRDDDGNLGLDDNKKDVL